MIKREDLLALEFYKARPFKGSDRGVRYMIAKEQIELPPPEGQELPEGEEPEVKTETILRAYIWPEPFCFEVTPDEKKISSDFPFSEEGLTMAMDFINQNHDQVAEEDK